MGRKVVNNTFYDHLGTDWYEAYDHPIALLRAENRARIPWVIAKIQEHFNSASTVLDIGCGAGLLNNALAEVGHVVCGIDLSKGSLEIARSKDKTQSVHYEVADAIHLPFLEQRFDVVCAMDLLEHVEKPAEVIKEASRVLKPGGLFFFHTFNRTWKSWLFALKGIEWFVPNAPPHMHLYRYFIKPQEIKTYLNNNHFELKEINGLMPALNKAFFQLILTRKITSDFTFKMNRSLTCGYIGLASRKLTHL